MENEGGNQNPELKVVRTHGETASAIVFLHGFMGTANTTWGTFIPTLLGDRRLDGWDVFSIGYSSRFTIDVPVWTSDPKLDVCAMGLRTKMAHPPLDEYKALAVVAHSMGGLVVQRAMLENVALHGRISHVILYGSPSGGLRKARFGRLLKKQVADMVEGGNFIRNLRRDWDREFGEGPPFAFKAVAGSEDSFVPPESSLMVFADRHREVVLGNHIDIVHPATVEHPSYEVFFKTLSNSGALKNTAESARLAVETNEYQSAVDVLLPGADRLDADATVTLALALESLGRRDEAMLVVNKHVEQGPATLDVIGVLAGRFKRRWLFSRWNADYERSLALYEDAYRRAVRVDNLEQAYYHEINIAFLKLMRGPEHEGISKEAREAARLALDFATRAHETSWSLATIGEASLILGDQEAALAAYARARKKADTVRAQHSMYSQALQVASRVYGDEGELKVKRVFEGL